MVRFEAAVALATNPDPKVAEITEDILQKLCQSDPMIKAAIEEFRRLNQ